MAEKNRDYTDWDVFIFRAWGHVSNCELSVTLLIQVCNAGRGFVQRQRLGYHNHTVSCRKKKNGGEPIGEFVDGEVTRRLKTG